MKRLSSNCHAAITKLLAGAMTLIAASVHCGAGSDAYGQSANGAATILISQELRVNAGTEAPLDIGVKTSNAAPNQLLLLIRGLPTAISLSRGRLFESGIWALRINDLPKLKITSEFDRVGE